MRVGLSDVGRYARVMIDAAGHGGRATFTAFALLVCPVNTITTMNLS